MPLICSSSVIDSRGALRARYGDRKLEIVVVALGAVGAVLPVRIVPVLDRVDDRVAVFLLDAERHQETVEAIGRRRVDVEAGLLVGDAVRVEPAGQLRLFAPEPRERAPIGAVEGQEAVFLFHDERGVGHDLADRLLDRGLGEMGADDPGLVRAHCRSFQTHRIRELGPDHRDQRHDEEHHQQREPALVSLPPPRDTRPRHWASVPTRSGTVKGRRACARPFSVPPTVTRIAFGRRFWVSTSHVSCQAPVSSR